MNRGNQETGPDLSGQSRPLCAAPSEKETPRQGVAVASVPPYSFLRAFGSKNGGTEATATSHPIGPDFLQRFLDECLVIFLRQVPPDQFGRDQV